MKERDVVLLQTAKLLEFKVHTEFGSVPMKLERDENNVVEITAYQAGKFAERDGKRCVIITETDNLAVAAAHEILMDYGIAVY